MSRRKAAATHPKETALIPDSFPMVGRAILTDDPIKAARKMGTVVTIRTKCLSMLSLDFMADIIAASALTSNWTRIY